MYQTTLSIKAAESLKDAERPVRPPKFRSVGRNYNLQITLRAISVEDIDQEPFERIDLKVTLPTMQSLDKSGMSKVELKNEPKVTQSPGHLWPQYV